MTDNNSNNKIVIFQNVIINGDNNNLAQIHSLDQNGQLHIEQHQQSVKDRTSNLYRLWTNTPQKLVRNVRDLSQRLSNRSRQSQQKHNTMVFNDNPYQVNDQFHLQQSQFVSGGILQPSQRKNSSDSDLSLSKLDIAEEYSTPGDFIDNNSLNTSRQPSEITKNTLTDNNNVSFLTWPLNTCRQLYFRFQQPFPLGRRHRT
ncbi:unnamed protein product, partial [Didymodactylos carnosus]